MTSVMPGAELAPSSNASECALLERLQAWNDTRTNYPRDKTVAQLFEEIAFAHTDSIAVTFGAKQLTYAELNVRANRLAHRLRMLGVGHETMVGCCLERSLELIVAFVGILKAGGAYVPLDPAYPRERLEFLLKDTNTPVVLTQKSLASTILAEHSLPRLLLDDEEQQTSSPLTDVNPTPLSGAQSLAYVMYTSGSTGRPKGVMVENRSIVRLVRDTNFCRLDARDVVLQFCSISFDPSSFEIWGALLNGGRLVIVPPQASLEEVESMIREHGVTTLALPAGVFSLMMAEDRLKDLCNLRQLLVGGEAFPPRHVRPVLENLPGCCLINSYGPTENTVMTSCHVVHHGDSVSPSVPIGRPVSNTQVYILDEHLRPVSPGTMGELYAGGDGVARGYLNNPEATKEKFLADPFATIAGARMYRTGDLARWREDGVVEFLGRADDQVKILGYRVELGEVEAVLATYEGIKQACVVARAQDSGTMRLIAYYVPSVELAVSPRQLHGFLANKLPHYMIPTQFVRMSSLPLSPHGKVDRRALPAPESERPETAEYAKARTPSEEVLNGIWCEVLGLDQIGIHDNFFAIGGHSLLATKVLARIRDAFGVELSLRTLFEAPTLAELASRLTNRAAAELDVGLPPLSSVPRDEYQPVTFAQERAWFLNQLVPDNRAYQLQATLRFTGAFDIQALEQSLGELLRRHEILRTTFPARDGRPVQIIHPAQPAPLRVLDLTPLTAAQIATKVQQLIDEEGQTPFALDRLPLVRWTLLRLSQHEHVLLHVEHHIIHDGWSFNVLLREFLELYSAFSAGQPSPLTEPLVQFADFAHWQRQWVAGSAAEQQLAWWTEQLAGAPQLLELPLDRPRPPVQRFRGRLLRSELSPQLARPLRGLSRQNSVTLFMTVLTAFLALLHRYTGQTDICVGTSIANRRSREAESLIGMILNNLVLRTDLSGQPTFRELLHRVRQVTLDAYAHQDLPFDKIVDALKPMRDLSYNPLFQVMLSFHDAPLPDLELPGLHVDLLEAISNNSAKFDLNITIIPRMEQRRGRSAAGTAEGIAVLWEYNSDLFDEATIARMVQHFEAMLTGMVEDLDRRLSDVALLSAQERQQILCGYNATLAEYPRTRCVHQWFEAQVARTPTAVAVICDDQRLTYQELDWRANQLAHLLLGEGVGPETIVGVCLERSLDMVVALLGVLKAGAAYLPLEPSYPSDRLAFMLRDAGAAALITWQRLGLELPSSSARTIRLDADRYLIDAQDVRSPGNATRPNNLAYVIYTSGSTGKPKAAMNQHDGMLNRLLWMQNEYELSAADCVLQKTPFSFDVSVWEFFWPLMTGARLVLARAGAHADPEYLAELIAKEGVTTVHFVPSMLQTFLEAPGTAALPSLKRVVCSGEVLPVSLQEHFINRMDANLHNLYGPTECAIDVSHWHCRPGMSRSTVPIGRPVANVQLYVLDDCLQPVPVGVVGELHVGGVQVGRGYLNRPDLTAERFIPDPFGGQSGARLYKTGDRARWRPDGTIDFLGRLDQQIKIRGFRIELGEVESVLASHPEVRETLVVTRSDPGDGDQRLIAYIVAQEPTQAPALSVGKLRAWLKTKLPEYMIPSAFVLLERLPLTANGKVDRRALPAPEASRSALAVAYVAPRTQAEELLAGIWAQVLGVPQVGVHDNFFELGGHSLLATQAVSRIRNAFHVDLSVIALFQAPTVGELAGQLASLGALQRSEIRPTAPTPLRTLLDELPDSEVDSLLSNMLREGDLPNERVRSAPARRET